MQPESIESRPEVRALTTQITEIEARAALPVETAEQYQSAAEFLQQVKGAQKRLEETRTGITKPLNETLRRINEFFRAPAERLATAERAVKRRMVAYADEQERIRREKQRQADEAARAERQKAEREAAAAREKAAREAEELRARAEAEAKAGREAEAAKLAARAESKVERAEAKAEALEVAAATTVAPIVQAEQPKVRGVATREVVRYEIVDAAALPREYLVPDEKRIGGVVRSLKMDARIPGVRVWIERAIAAGAA